MTLPLSVPDDSEAVTLAEPLQVRADYVAHPLMTGIVDGGDRQAKAASSVCSSQRPYSNWM